ncbi:HEAT repeat domain-containing protein [Agrococcus sp. KRD186]|uniref:HEAT repeat domain-containing protein n=1 Tax=Agrococcus sp. KRD186 TaxID=2729730 RepID=UPI001F4A0326|nr:HEAT repeat domain-containing protein [Agrococcus sp. KRD186]
MPTTQQDSQPESSHHSAHDVQRAAGGAGLYAALTHGDSSVRLQAALTAGTYPDDSRLGALIARFGAEPDFYVRDMLTWAVTRHPATATLPLVEAELASPVAQARAQALHTLSKLGEPSSWPALEAALLHDADAEVARAAWRAAVALVPADEEARLAAHLIAELGRGDAEVQRSLSRALVELGDAAVPALEEAAAAGKERVRVHAVATLALLRDPDSSFAGHLEEATRAVIRRDAPQPVDTGAEPTPEDAHRPGSAVGAG